MLRQIAYKVWKKKPEEEQEKSKKEVIKKLGFDPNDESMYVRLTEKGMKEVLSRLPQSAYKTWYASLTRADSQVGYRGFIPVKFIKLIDPCKGEKCNLSLG